MDLRSFQKILSTTCDLQKDLPLVVGVSGGPDSLCLLHLLHTSGYLVVAVHVNHQLRPEADTEEAAVRAFAESLAVPFVQTRVDVKRFAEQEKLSIEESARILRYRFLMQVAQEQNAQAVAVAHQADDQIETVLMHLLRGSGLAGLRGMPYRGTLPVFSSILPIVRPLLGVWREEILNYCAENGISPCYDASNQDTRYFRNRIRQELVPLLKTYNEQAPQHLWQLANLVGAEEDLLQEQTQVALARVNSQFSEGYILFDRIGYQNLSLALQRRLFRTYLEHFQKNLRDIGVEVVQRAEEFLSQKNPSGACQLLDGIWLSRFNPAQMVIYQKEASFEKEFPLLSTREPKALVVPGVIQINPFWQMRSEWIAPLTEGFAREDWTLYLDGAALNDLSLTHADTAERFCFMSHRESRIKVGDLFTDKKVFPPARPSWPVLRCGEQILWLPGLKRSNLAMVSGQTERILRIMIMKIDPTE